MSLFSRDKLRTAGTKAVHGFQRGAEKVGHAATVGAERTGRYIYHQARESQIARELGKEYDERRAGYFAERRVKAVIARNTRLKYHAAREAERYGVRPVPTPFFKSRDLERKKLNPYREAEKKADIKAYEKYQQKLANKRYGIKERKKPRKQLYYVNPRYIANPY